MSGLTVFFRQYYHHQQDLNHDGNDPTNDMNADTNNYPPLQQQQQQQQQQRQQYSQSLISTIGGNDHSNAAVAATTTTTNTTTTTTTTTTSSSSSSSSSFKVWRKQQCAQLQKYITQRLFDSIDPTTSTTTTTTTVQQQQEQQQQQAEEEEEQQQQQSQIVPPSNKYNNNNNNDDGDIDGDIDDDDGDIDDNDETTQQQQEEEEEELQLLESQLPPPPAAAAAAAAADGDNNNKYDTTATTRAIATAATALDVETTTTTAAAAATATTTSSSSSSNVPKITETYDIVSHISNIDLYTRYFHCCSMNRTTITTTAITSYNQNNNNNNNNRNNHQSQYHHRHRQYLQISKVWNIRTTMKRRKMIKVPSSLLSSSSLQPLSWNHHHAHTQQQSLSLLYFQYDGPLAVLYDRVVCIEYYQPLLLNNNNNNNNNKDAITTIYTNSSSIMTAATTATAASPTIPTINHLLVDHNNKTTNKKEYIRFFWYDTYADIINTIITDCNQYIEQQINTTNKNRLHNNNNSSNNNTMNNNNNNNNDHYGVELFMSFDHIPAKCIFPYKIYNSNNNTNNHDNETDHVVPTLPQQQQQDDDDDTDDTDTDWYDAYHTVPYCICIGGDSAMKISSTITTTTTNDVFEPQQQSQPPPPITTVEQLTPICFDTNDHPSIIDDTTSFETTTANVTQQQQQQNEPIQIKCYMIPYGCCYDAATIEQQQQQQQSSSLSGNGTAFSKEQQQRNIEEEEEERIINDELDNDCDDLPNQIIEYTILTREHLLNHRDDDDDVNDNAADHGDRTTTSSDPTTTTSFSTQQPQLISNVYTLLHHRNKIRSIWKQIKQQQFKSILHRTQQQSKQQQSKNDMIQFPSRVVVDSGRDNDDDEIDTDNETTTTGNNTTSAPNNNNNKKRSASATTTTTRTPISIMQSPTLTSPGARLKRRRLMNVASDDIQYQLSDLPTLPTQTKFSFYAAVLSFNQPYRTKRGDWTMSVQLVDDSLELCANGFSDTAFVHAVTCNIFVKPDRFDTLPMVRYAGDIIRLWNVQKQVWNNEVQLISSKDSTFVTLRSNGNKPDGSQSKPEMFPSDDENIVLSDMEWEHMLDMWHWAQRRMMLHATMKIAHRFRLSDMHLPDSTHTEAYGAENTRGDLTAMVAAIIPVVADQSVAGISPCGFVRVWDGTGVPKSDILPIDSDEARKSVQDGDPPPIALIKIAAIVKKLKDLRQNPDLQPPKQLSGRVANVAIWEKQHWELITKGHVSVGSFIRLRNVQDTIYPNTNFRCLHVHAKSSLTPLPNSTFEVLYLLEEHNNRLLRMDPTNNDSGLLPLYVDNEIQDSNRTSISVTRLQSPAAESSSGRVATNALATAGLNNPKYYITLGDFLNAPIPSTFLGRVKIVSIYPSYQTLLDKGVEAICPAKGSTSERFFQFGLEIDDGATRLSVIVSDNRPNTSVGKTLLGVSCAEVLLNPDLITVLRDLNRRNVFYEARVSNVEYKSSKYFLLDSLRSL